MALETLFPLHIFAPWRRHERLNAVANVSLRMTNLDDGSKDHLNATRIVATPQFGVIDHERFVFRH
jgi:hypothetical protein